MNDFVTSSTEEDKDSPTPVDVPLVDQSGRYRIGDPERPDIQHDNGFLDSFEAREPTISERLEVVKWRVKLDGGYVLRGRELKEALDAYNNFQYGKGADLILPYEKYINDDISGRLSFHNIKRDFARHVEIIGQNREEFSVTSTHYQMGGLDPSFPYPATENWQKAIGGHAVWVSADVAIVYAKSSDTDWYKANVTLHMEDRYNFNPGASDIATGIPDSANGVFEVTGLAKQFMTYGTYNFLLEWKEGEVDSAYFKEVSAPQGR